MADSSSSVGNDNRFPWLVFEQSCDSLVVTVTVTVTVTVSFLALVATLGEATNCNRKTVTLAVRKAVRYGAVYAASVLRGSLDTRASPRIFVPTTPCSRELSALNSRPKPRQHLSFKHSFLSQDRISTSRRHEI